MKQYTENEFNEFTRSGDLTGRKLREYIPAMVMTNLSMLLLISVDGLVAGNLVGSDALSSINIFFPVAVLTGVISTLASSGIATAISTAMGKNNVEEIDRIKGASLRTMIGMAVIMALVQVPVVWLVIGSYGLSEEMYAMTWQYAIGIMLCSPLSLVSTVGTFQLQIAGKMKALMWLSVAEGVANLAFDLLFVGAMDMGVAGAGYGTACANVIRCSATVIYLARATDIYKSKYKKCTIKDIKDVLRDGMPDASYSLIVAFQNYFIMKVLLDSFGVDGGVIKGVCVFCFNLTNVLIGGITGGMRPLMGLLAGAGDKEGLRILMKQGARLNLISAGLATLIIEIAPQWFYYMHGVHDIPEGGLLSVRLFSLYFVFKGADFILRLYLSNRKDSKYATFITVLGNITLPIFAYIIAAFAPAPYIFLAYMATELILFGFSWGRYRKWLEKDRKEEAENSDDIILYMTVKPDEAVDASRAIRAFAEKHGIERRVAYRVALCVEEMAAYVKEAEAKSRIEKFVEEHNLIDHDVSVEMMVRFKGKDEAIFVTLDDGTCIALDIDKEKQQLITDNYELLKKVAKSVEYQYILDMNYVRFTF